MTAPYLLPSKQIRRDGIYFYIRQLGQYTNYNEPERPFIFDGVAISAIDRFFYFSRTFMRNEWEFYDYGIKGVLKDFAKTIINTPVDAIYPEKYNISYNAHNITASYAYTNEEYNFVDSEVTIVCSLYSTNQLRVEKFILHIKENWVEEKGDELFNFISFDDINKGISKSLEDSLYPIARKKRWWEI